MRSGRGGQRRGGVRATWRGAALRERERERESEKERERKRKRENRMRWVGGFGSVQIGLHSKWRP